MARQSRLDLRRSGAFPIICAGQTVSLIGSRLYHVCLLAFVYQMSASAGDIGLLLTWLTLPTLVIGPVAGLLADRYSSKVIMVVADAARAVVCLILWVYPTLSVAFFASAVMGCCQALFNPAWTIAIPDVVPKHDIIKANAMWAVGRRIAHITGPAIAGLLIAAGQSRLSFLINAASFLIGIGCVAWALIPRRMSVRPGGRVVESMLQAVRLIRRHAILVCLVGLFAIHGLMTGINNVLIVPYAYELGPTGMELGILVTALACGLLAGSLTLTLCRPAPWRLSRYSLLVMGVGLFMLGVCRSLIAAVAARVLIGVGEAAFSLGTTTFLQTQVPHGLRGRVIGLFRSFEEGLILIGLSAGGVLAAVCRASAAIAATGAAAVIVALAAAALGRERGLSKEEVSVEPERN